MADRLVLAARALHAPVLHTASEPTHFVEGRTEVRCRTCLDEDNGWVSWPCPTAEVLESPPVLVMQEVIPKLPPVPRAEKCDARLISAPRALPDDADPWTIWFEPGATRLQWECTSCAIDPAADGRFYGDTLEAENASVRRFAQHLGIKDCDHLNGIATLHALSGFEAARSLIEELIGGPVPRKPSEWGHLMDSFSFPQRYALGVPRMSGKNAAMQQIMASSITAGAITADRLAVGSLNRASLVSVV